MHHPSREDPPFRSVPPGEQPALLAVHEDQHRVLEDFLEALYGELERPLVFHYLVLGLEAVVLRHLKVEEEEVLAQYRRSVPAPEPRARSEEYERDHALLRAALERLLDDALLVHFERLEPALLRQRLAGLDELLEHHDQRETDLLYPPLVRALEPAVLESLTHSLEEVPVMEAAALREAAAALAAHPVQHALEKLYRAWLAGTPAAAEPLPELPLPAAHPARSALPKLLARDRRLLQQFAGLSAEDRRARAREERRVDETLRSTLRFAMKAFLHAAMQGEAR